MPKEVTYGDRPYSGKWKQDIDGPEKEVDVPVVGVVEVRWDRESGYFQIATLSYDSVIGGVVSEYPLGLRELHTGQLTKEAEAAEEEEWLARNQGLYVTLDRKGINKLIRDLRRARDQAFGRDE